MTLDWRDRPAASPNSGFFIQVRTGEPGNFEVVIPWPDGGLAHYWRNNDAPALVWHGPTFFAKGTRYVGASLIESDNIAFMSDPRNNLEVMATREDGTVEHWSRENGGALVWSNFGTVLTGASGAAGIAYSGAAFAEGIFGVDLESHLENDFFVVAPMTGGGFVMLKRQNPASGNTTIPPWTRIGGPSSNEPFGGTILTDRNFVGAGLALTTLFNPFLKAGWKEMRDTCNGVCRGQVMITTVSDQGALHIYTWARTKLGGGDLFADSNWGWNEGLTITQPAELGHILRPFRGRPCLLQGDYDLTESSDFIPWDSAHYGNLELVAPAKDGGILHFWRDNGDVGEPRKLKDGWHYGGKIGGSLYDEVSLLQSNFGDADHGPLEMIARTRDQKGFDFFWRDDAMAWHGPQNVSWAEGPTGTIAQPLSPDDSISALHSINLDFSVPRDELKQWLDNPQFTPYPAITSALLGLVEGRKLRDPIFLDVIVFNYENTPGVVSPRAASDVRIDILKDAVLEGYNVRHGTHVTDFEAILA
ncbi:hypothetical protein [Streptomyces sp. NPDC052012]|uniref:hypothetical protein n=1 Tax=Streptomyces sp. NPDC052012 TaxID=3155051 RepID=UPI00344EC3C7